MRVLLYVRLYDFRSSIEDEHTCMYSEASEIAYGTDHLKHREED